MFYVFSLRLRVFSDVIISICFLVRLCSTVLKYFCNIHSLNNVEPSFDIIVDIDIDYRKMTKKSDFEIKVLLHQLSILHKQLKTFKLKGIKRNCNRQNLGRVEHGGRVVKALDLSSNGSNSAWVRTPPVLRVLFSIVGISCNYKST